MVNKLLVLPNVVSRKTQEAKEEKANCLGMLCTILVEITKVNPNLCVRHMLKTVAGSNSCYQDLARDPAKSPQCNFATVLPRSTNGSSDPIAGT